MKKISSVVVTFLIGATVSACGHHGMGGHDRHKFSAHKFEMMDGDKDGFVTKEEFLASTQKHFDEMDGNKDGKLTQDEMQEFRKEKWGRKRSGHHHE